jgi:zinc transport system ATP-binding protein
VTEACALQDVSVTFGEVPVLRNVSIQMQQGSCVVVLGANGCGKSTFMKAFLGLVPISKGSASLFQTEVRSLRLWGRVGYAPQRVPDMRGIPVSVEEFVASGLVGARPLPQARGAIRAALANMDLQSIRRCSISELSGGQQRRALLARTLARESDLIFLDEPTAGVDTQGQECLAQALQERKHSGKTTVIVTHMRDAVFDLADRYMVVQQSVTGNIAFDGPIPPTDSAVSDPIPTTLKAMSVPAQC